MQDNVIGLYIKFSDEYDTLEFVRYIFSRQRDQLGIVCIKEIEREYIFFDMEGLTDNIYRFDNFYDYLGSCLFYKKLSFSVYPYKQLGMMIETYDQFKRSNSTFACKCWDLKNAMLFIKEKDVMDIAYNVCRNYRFDDLRILTEENLPKDTMLI